MANAWYNRGKASVMDGTLDFDTHTVKVMLVDSGYTFNADDDYVSSGAGTPGGEELTGTGYTAGFGGAGRKTIGSPTVTADDTNDRAVFDGADISWTAINAGTAKAMILIREITNDAASILIAYIDTVASGATFPITTNGGDVNITWGATGILHIT